MGKETLMINNFIKVSLLAKHELIKNKKLFDTFSHLNNKSKEYKNFLELKNYGYTIIENFLNVETIDRIVTKLDNFYKRPTINDKDYRIGGARWQNIENDFPEIKTSLFQNNTVQKIIKTYLENGFNDFKKLVYQHSYYEKNLDSYNKKEIGLGRSWHCDTWKNEIKLMLFCTDINVFNGPLEVIPKSHKFLSNPIKWDYFKKILSVIYPSKFNSDNLFFTMKKSNYVSEKIIGKKGSLAIFNTRCLHKASILKKDQRKVIWAYF